MTIGSLGKVLANQAIESTKNTVMDAVRPSEPAKPAESKPGLQDTGAVIIGQIQAMQRPLREDQELAVTFRAGNEMLRITEIFVPNAQVLVFAGVDPEGNVTRVIAPVDTAQVVCKVVPVATGANPVRVNVLTPKPQPKPAA
ncbi:MAG: hypothetical protein ABSG41_00590 [Bryobacteraceae bacterium]|jgi:hypothetical protein